MARDLRCSALVSAFEMDLSLEDLIVAPQESIGLSREQSSPSLLEHYHRLAALSFNRLTFSPSVTQTPIAIIHVGLRDDPLIECRDGERTLSVEGERGKKKEEVIKSLLQKPAGSIVSLMACRITGQHVLGSNR